MEEMLTIGDVAKRIGMSASTVRNLCDSGAIKSVRPTGPTGHRRIPASSVDGYLASLGFEPKTKQIEESLNDVLSMIRTTV